MMGFGLIFMLLFWGLLIAGAVWLVKAIFPGVQGGGSSFLKSSPSAGEILDQRYARGEIDREEYDRMKRDLNL